ncbi:MAG: hypothetical protein HY791_11560 [Deltaproteobacteria bacterium]|nr:hypothetical protein [Deltaproteobacteria bacterium]
MSARIQSPPTGAPLVQSAGTASSTKPADGTVRASVDREATFDGRLEASVLHDVLVKAGAQVDASDLAVKLGSPRLVTSNIVASPDGKSLEREDEIEVTLVIKTRQRLSVFVDALAGATVDAATLTLTPRASKPTVSVEGDLVRTPGTEQR